MDILAAAEQSRYVVAAAVLLYLGAWVAFCAEAGIRSRLRRESAALVGAGATASARDGSANVLVAERDDDDATAAREGTDTEQDAEKAGRVGRLVFVAATAVLAVGVFMRAIGVERVPWGNMHEFSITGSLVASVTLIVLSRKPAVRAVSVWAGLLIFVTLTLSITFLYVEPGPIVPALRSYWLVIHVGAAVTAFGLFTVGAALSGLQIAAERAEKRGQTTGLAGSLPSSRLLDRYAYRLTAIAFPIWTVGPLILGAVWAEVSWGRYWGWDPKEVWALITWLAYAAYLHARATAGWSGKKASIVSLVGFATLVFSYFGVNIFFSGLHAYGGL